MNTYRAGVCIKKTHPLSKNSATPFQTTSLHQGMGVSGSEWAVCVCVCGGGGGGGGVWFCWDKPTFYGWTVVAFSEQQLLTHHLHFLLGQTLHMPGSVAKQQAHEDGFGQQLVQVEPGLQKAAVLRRPGCQQEHPVVVWPEGRVKLHHDLVAVRHSCSQVIGWHMNCTATFWLMLAA